MLELRLSKLGLLTALSATLLPAAASAHIDILAPFKSRGANGSDAQKMFPCDGPGWGSGGTTYTFEPGATITLGVKEAIPHPGYFRIAFDRDATASFKDPVSIFPLEDDRVPVADQRPGNPRCLKDPNDQCLVSDFCTRYADDTGVTVLWDRLDHHETIPLFEGVVNPPMRTWTITLPDIECEKCTIQVIQVMEDVSHGAYCPKDMACPNDTSLEDVYHRCIDVTLKRGATNSPSSQPAKPPTGMAMECSKVEVDDAGVVLVPDASVPTETPDYADAGVAPGGGHQHGDAGPGSLDGGPGATPQGPAPVDEDDGCSTLPGRAAGHSGLLLMLLAAALGLSLRRSLRTK